MTRETFKNFVANFGAAICTIAFVAICLSFLFDEGSRHPLSVPRQSTQEQLGADAETNRLLGEIAAMESELRKVRQPYIEKKGEAGAKEIDNMLVELERMRERLKNAR